MHRRCALMHDGRIRIRFVRIVPHRCRRVVDLQVHPAVMRLTANEELDPKRDVPERGVPRRIAATLWTETRCLVIQQAASAPIASAFDARSGWKRVNDGAD